MNAAIRPSLLINVLIGVLSFVLAFPLFILAYHRLPDLDWPFHADKLVTFFVIAIFLLLMVRSYKYIIVTAVIAVVGWLWYGTVNGQYGFEELYRDGRAVVYGMSGSGTKKEFVFSGTRSLSTDRQILKAIDYQDKGVRNFAVQATNEYFSDAQQASKTKYRTTIQCLAVFKKINVNWNYVSDPNRLTCSPVIAMIIPY
jgi:hypothetical protein